MTSKTTTKKALQFAILGICIIALLCSAVVFATSGSDITAKADTIPTVTTNTISIHDFTYNVESEAASTAQSSFGDNSTIIVVWGGSGDSYNCMYYVGTPGMEWQTGDSQSLSSMKQLIVENGYTFYVFGKITEGYTVGKTFTTGQANVSATYGTASKAIGIGTLVPVGETVTVSATPTANYKVTGVKVYKTGESTTTVAYNSTSGTFTMPAFKTTIEVTTAEKKTVSIDTTAQEVTYDGEVQTFELKGDDKDLDFEVSYFDSTQSAIEASEVVDAGQYYVSIAYDGDDEYKAYETASKISFVINKADYVMTSAAWDYTDAFNYDGNEKTVTVTGLPDGVTVCAYTDNSMTDAGDYTASVTFNYDTTNYNEPTIDDLDWSIEKGNLDMTNAAWNYTVAFTADGTAKTVVVIGLPAGVTVDSYTNNSFTDAGTYTATVTFAYDTANYNEISLEDLAWEIKAAEQPKEEPAPVEPTPEEPAPVEPAPVEPAKVNTFAVAIALAAIGLFTLLIIIFLILANRDKKDKKDVEIIID